MKKYFCIKDYIMTDGSIAYKAGETYKVKERLEGEEEVGWFVLPSHFDKTHRMIEDEDFFNHFVDIKKEQKKVLKRLKRYQDDLPWAMESSARHGYFLDEFVGVEGITVNGHEVVAPKDSVVESVINQFKERSEVGFKKYGTNLDRKDLNVLEWMQHLQEELMDACLYVEKLKKEVWVRKNIK